MPSWTWVLAQPNGTALAELTTAAGKRISYRRNGVPEATCTISHEDDDASTIWDTLLNAGIPNLKAYRNGVLRFNGYLAPFQEDAEEQSTMSLVFRGPFGRLLGDGDGSGRFTGEFDDFIADAGQVAKSLIDNANTDGPTGIATTGTIEATKVRERTYEYANVGESIIQLTEVLDGFDFEVVPLDLGSTIGEFKVYAKQGGAADAVFEYGPGTLANVRSMTRSVRPPVNAVRILGSEGLAAEAFDIASIAKYGKRWRQESITDLDDDLIIQDKAYALLRPNPSRVVSFVPELALSPRPFDDFGIGDTVALHARRGALEENVNVRVNEIAVTIDEEGNETAEVPDPLDPTEEATLKALLSVEVL